MTKKFPIDPRDREYLFDYSGGMFFPEPPETPEDEDMRLLSVEYLSEDY